MSLLNSKLPSHLPLPTSATFDGKLPTPIAVLQPQRPLQRLPRLPQPTRFYRLGTFLHSVLLLPNFLLESSLWSALSILHE